MIYLKKYLGKWFLIFYLIINYNINDYLLISKIQIK